MANGMIQHLDKSKHILVFSVFSMLRKENNTDVPLTHLLVSYNTSYFLRFSIKTRIYPKNPANKSRFFGVFVSGGLMALASKRGLLADES